jgi:hypothetical protein
VAIGACPKHWWAGKHRARDGRLQCCNKKAVIATPWCAEGGEGGVATEPVANQQLALLRAIKIGEICC